jgi:tRNA A37 threonylcarbamoyladenosine modification protein TsaB
MAVAKWLALALDIPIIGISTFEVIAARLRDEFNHFYLAASARRGEYYLCRISTGTDIRSSFALVEADDFPAAVNDSSVGFIGDVPGEISDAVKLVIPQDRLYISGGELAVLAERRLASGHADSLSELEPHYIAPSQAERKFGRQ